MHDDNPVCEYFESYRCRSCTLIETPYSAQLREKQLSVAEVLAPFVPHEAWLPAVPGGVSDFRNKAKLVVGGTASREPARGRDRDRAARGSRGEGDTPPWGRITLGIAAREGSGIDLRDCLIQQSAIRAAIPHLADFLESTGLPPYDVPNRRGELKFVHVTASPAGELMLRFVVRSVRAAGIIRDRLPELMHAVPNAVVVSVNLLPEHKAVLEGDREELLVGSDLRMDSGGGVALHLLPQSFFQTNTEVARELYTQAAAWVDRASPASVWDLYCGVGGFALHVAGDDRSTGAPRQVTGVEISEAAVHSAARSAREAGIEARFVAADATMFALAADPTQAPECVIVNPPRRGIGPELAEWIERSAIPHVIYSSCNPRTLATDLAAMPSLSVREARVFDMFPHTTHAEVAVLLRRSE